MSMALIVQMQENTIGGGSLQGFLSGSDTVSSSDSFFGRRMTNMHINESSGGVPTVNTFTPSTGGTGAASTPGQFTLVPGTYRISVRATYTLSVASQTIIAGLYNVSTSLFEVYTGTAVPIVSSVVSEGGNIIGNMLLVMEGGFAVATTNKTFEFRHKGSSTTVVRTNSFGGSPTTMTGANVNFAAALNTYLWIKLLKTA